VCGERGAKPKVMDSKVSLVQIREKDSSAAYGET
jgi:hypothetical protein